MSGYNFNPVESCAAKTCKQSGGEESREPPKTPCLLTTALLVPVAWPVINPHRARKPGMKGTSSQALYPSSDLFLAHFSFVSFLWGLERLYKTGSKVCQHPSAHPKGSWGHWRQCYRDTGGNRNGPGRPQDGMCWHALVHPHPSFQIRHKVPTQAVCATQHSKPPFIFLDLWKVLKDCSGILLRRGGSCHMSWFSGSWILTLREQPGA